LATVNPDGSPQVTPVWVDENDGYVLVNTAVGRLKERNTRQDPRVALAVPDWEDPYTYVEIRIGFKLFLMLSIIFFLLSW
jgi:PPOX class probable F420-dependent enzyme